MANTYIIYNANFLPSVDDLVIDNYEALRETNFTPDIEEVFSFIQEMTIPIYKKYVNIADILERATFILIHYEFYKLMTDARTEDALVDTHYGYDEPEFLEYFKETYDIEGDLFDTLYNNETI